MSRGLPNTVGIEAAYGTVFHDYAADCAELGLDPQHFVGDGFDTGDGFGWLEFDQAMADNMLFPDTQEGIDAFIEKRDPRWK